MNTKAIHIIGGGTVSHVRTHLSMTTDLAIPDLSAQVYGATAWQLGDMVQGHNMDVFVHLTRMADPTSKIETNEHVDHLLSFLVSQPSTKIIFMPVALMDFDGIVGNEASGKYATRLKSRSEEEIYIRLVPKPKLLPLIRKTRKDIFLVAFKTTVGETEDAQYVAGLNLLKESSANLVLANDVKTRMNMVITPEEARYHVTLDRTQALQGLVDMAILRSHLTFTRSTVVAGEPIPWNSELVPTALRAVVNYCVENNAYKPFRGSTVGHFACKISDTTFLTSIRKSNFNDLERNGLVKIETDGPDSVIAYGSKPSVGGQSQRIVFTDHPEYDCIAHFHCPIKEGSEVPVVSQREYECGSHECGHNTSNGLKKFGNLSAVYLDDHGPNVVFHRSINPQEVIDFIEKNFDLSEKTGGCVYATPQEGV